MVKYTEPLLRVALKSVANAVRKAVGLRTPMLDKRGGGVLVGGWAVVPSLLCSMMGWVGGGG